MQLQEITLQIVAIFGMIGLGYFIERSKQYPINFSAALSKLVINVFYPALIFSAIIQRYTLEKLANDWIMPVGAAVIIAVGWTIGRFAKQYLVRHYRAPTRRAFHFSCVMNNYSFLPIMIIAGSPWGTEGVALVALTTIASDSLMWTLGFSTLTGQRVKWQEIPKICLRPPVMALLLAIACLCLMAIVNVLFGWHITNETLLENPYSSIIINTLYKYIGNATIPTSAIVCGMCLSRIPLKGLFSKLQLQTTLFRMVIIPAILITIIALVPGLTEGQRFVFSIIALMPGAMGGVSIAEVYGGDTTFVSAMIFNTHITCICTVPIGLWILSKLV